MTAPPANVQKQANGSHVRKLRNQAKKHKRAPHVKPELAKHGLKGIR